MRKCIVSVFLIFIVSLTYAQNITGVIVDDESGEAVIGANAYLEGTSHSVYTNATGKFRMYGVESGNYILMVNFNDYTFKYGQVTVGDEALDLGEIHVEPQQIEIDASEIAVINLNTSSDLDGDNGISSVLASGRDPFVEAASYNLSAGRFRIRGYGNQDRATYINGFHANDLDDGGVYWGTWGGLNDVFRAQSNTFTLDPLQYGFGGVGGGTSVDLRASVQRPQTKLVMNYGNRAYKQRLMLTHSSGEQENGWSYSLSASRRWGDQGYIKGTFYDAWSYFASVEKKLNDNHSLGLVVLGAPSFRGRSSGSTQEMYDLVGDNYYNPNWGYQNGKVRNARAYKFHQPIGILRHDWSITDKLDLTTSLAYETGYNGTTRLDWFNAPDPRPDYYRKLPSYQLTEETAAAVTDYIKNNESAQQIDWDRLYSINRNRVVTINNANGSGEALTGNLSAYVVEEQRYDNEKLAFNTNLTAFVNNAFTITGGLNYRREYVHNYKVLNDLLGGEYYVDLDKFAERDFPDNEDFAQNNLLAPNRILKEGDRYGWDYDIVTDRAGGWVQGEWKLDRVDFFIASELTRNSFYRDSKYQNGKFPNNSLGKSETQSFNNYGVKGGVTFKVDGRNYIYANGTMRTRSPFSRYAYTSPRTRHSLLPDLQNEEIQGGEVGYIFRYPGVKGRVTAFYTEFNNQLESTNVYFDLQNSFGTYVLRGVDTKHQGVEFGIEAKASPTVTVSFAGSIGAHQYNSRPTRFFTIDNQPGSKVSSEVAYIKNYYLPGPNTGLSLELEYRSPKFWFATASLNHYRGMYLDIFPERRTNTIVSDILLPDRADFYHKVIDQVKLDNQFSVDLFAGKSWKIDDYYLQLLVSVGNVLNNRNFITGGFEQFRYDRQDPDKFDPRVYYAYGINYSIGLSLRM